jgi:hypothetical protein
VREAVVETRGVESAYQTVVKFGASGPRIHIFWRGDDDPNCHDHPADFWTFPLTSYMEAFLDSSGNMDVRVVKAFRLHRRKAEFAHLLLGRFGPTRAPRWDARSPIVTLVWWGKKRREWGFHTPKGWVPWRTYTNTPEPTP